MILVKFAVIYIKGRMAHVLQDQFDKYLVVTFIGETRILAMNMDEELEECEIPGFDADAQTLYCGNVVHDQIIQVTQSSVRLMDAESGKLFIQWSPPSGTQVGPVALTVHVSRQNLWLKHGLVACNNWATLLRSTWRQRMHRK